MKAKNLYECICTKFHEEVEDVEMCNYKEGEKQGQIKAYKKCLEIITHRQAGYEEFNFDLECLKEEIEKELKEK